METDKPLVWIHSEIKSPPFSEEARIQAGVLLRKLQKRESIPFPLSKPMPSIGRNCHELRINDSKRGVTRRIIYHISSIAIVILGEFEKKTAKMPQKVISSCQDRLQKFYADNKDTE